MANLKRRKSLETNTRLNTYSALSAKSPLSKGTQGLRRSQGVKARKSTKPSLKTISQLKKIADKYFSLATRYRFAELVNGEYVAQCFTCTVKEWKPIKTLQCGHFMSRAHNNTRYSEENTAPQCYGCNVMQQGRQYAFGLEIDKLYGAGTAKRLYKEAKVPLQFKREDLEEIIRESKEQVKYYETQIST